MNIAEIEIPDHMQGTAGALAAVAREQGRFQEAIRAITRPPALGELQYTLERARLHTPTLQMAEQAREIASVTERVTEQIRSTLRVSERLNFPEINPVSERLAEIAANSPVIGLGAEMDGIRHSLESFRRSCPDLSEIDALAGLRDSLPSWSEITAPGLQPRTAEWRPGFYRGVDPVLPLTREGEFELPLSETSGSDVPAETREGYARMFLFENALRRFVPEQLAAAFGPGWEKHRVPGDIRKKWWDKQEQARAAGDTPEPLIAYADLDDYRAIIVRNDNWQAVFKPFYGRKDFVNECFRRLHPPRHAIAHMRSLTTDELELVRVETRLLLRAMGEGDVL